MKKRIFRPLKLASFLVLACCSILPVAGLAEVKIGVILPLSGPLAHSGTAVRDGIQEAIGAEPNVTIFFEDSLYTVPGALNAYRALTEKGIDGLVIFGSPPALALQPLLTKQDIKTIALAAANQLDAAPDSKIVRIWESGEAFGSAMGRHASQFERVAILSAEHEATLSGKGKIISQLTRSAVVDENIAPSERDFLTIALKVKKTNPDLIIANLLGAQNTLFIEKLRQLNIGVPVITQSSLFFDSKVIEPYPSFLEGVTVAGIDANGLPSCMKNFNKMAKERAGFIQPDLDMMRPVTFLKSCNLAGHLRLIHSPG